MNGFGGAVKLKGETEYRKALQQINQSLKETSSELKAVSTAYAANDRSQNATSAKAEVLNKKLQEQQQKLSLLKSEYSNMSAQYATQTSKHNALVAEYDKEKKKLDEIGNTLGTTSKEYQDQKTKVDALSAEVEKSSKAEDENAKAMSKMRTEINNAQADCNKTSQALAELSSETDDATASANNAGDGFTVFKGIVANLASQAIMAAINALKRLAGALIDVGKQAFNSYAQYEQLVGGVETLFGKSAPVVEKYAERAYKTAGLSANNYMNTVTSFSASLIQSLDGDTAKAAKVADRAIRDMSDNANKMGTDIGSIQNAYQGFAKANYTMLDNLKLGYGGNKTEMQRLIKDASKMNDVQKELGITVKDGDMSFANIANAISVAQKNMGIMGTTAKEADTTIEGSVNSMKAAWDNLLTGVADDQADLDKLTNDFVDSSITALSNIVPRIMPIITGLAEAAVNGLKEILPRITKEIAPLIQPALMDLVNKVPEVLQNLAAKFSEFAPTIAQYGADLLMKLGAGFIQALPSLLSALGDIINGLLKFVAGVPALMLAQGLKMIGKLALGILKGLNEATKAAGKIVSAILKKIRELPGKLLSAAFEAVKSFASGIAKGVSSAVDKAKALVDRVKNAVKNGFSNLGNIGLNLVKGIWNGISNGTSWIKSRIRSWVGSVTSFLKKLFKIASPSKLYEEEIGKNLALGIGVGFTDEMKKVETDMGNAIPKSFDLTSDGVNGARYDSAAMNPVDAFKQALSQMKIELDDEVAGHFVEKTVTRIIYA